MTRRSRYLLLSGLALLLSACSGASTPMAATATGTRSPSPTASPSPSSAATAPSPLASASASVVPRSAGEAQLRALVPQLQAFVAKQKGLDYKRPVAINLLDEAAFERRLIEVGKPKPADIAREQATLTALGLLPPGSDLSAELDELLAGGVVGFYDPKTAELVVRGAADTPATRTVLVHELTHALQDQNFDLNRPEVDAAHDEQSTALSALAEGDAKTVEAAYVASLPLAEQAQAYRSGGGAPQVPAVLLRLLSFPYQAGPPFVAALDRAGGEARVDDAFRHPPTTSEQVLHPKRFLAGEGPRAVPKPAADGAAADDGSLGELGLRLALTPVLGSAAATGAVDGWGGDAYVTWTAGGRTCLRDTAVGDDAAATGRLRDALGRWARADRGVSVNTGPGVTVTACHG